MAHSDRLTPFMGTVHHIFCETCCCSENSAMTVNGFNKNDFAAALRKDGWTVAFGKPKCPNCNLKGH